MIRNDIDENALNKTDRLGLAACRLNSWEWDEIFGPKPEGWDDLPNWTEDGAPSKFIFANPKIQEIKSAIGEEDVNRCWWIFALGRSEEEWRAWYWGERLEFSPPRNPLQKISRFWKGGNSKKSGREKLKNLPMTIRSFFAKH